MCRGSGLPSRRQPSTVRVKLSVVIPVYNEERWIREIVRRVREVPIPKEVILVDDCSKDGTRKILDEEISKLPDCRVIYHEVNQGKGAGVDLPGSALQHASDPHKSDERGASAP